ncbi:hypothetical protein HanRHA438_Chr14g0650351 [Helianthus annuus]|nr:hypothetical protein HanRHA438_Chr14g0650351 [Helianthus annuus]
MLGAAGLRCRYWVHVRDEHGTHLVPKVPVLKIPKSGYRYRIYPVRFGTGTVPVF